MNTPLVSICAPCYNVAPYIGRFLDSILDQTYKNLEVILVNDGSTDETNSVILSYIPLLQKHGFLVKYVEQENGGLAAAINTALKYVTGSYVTWPDPDDRLLPDSIECRVLFLESHKDISLVRGHMEKWDEKNNISLGLLDYKPSGSGPYDDLFIDSLHSTVSMAALSNMLRVSALDHAIPNREIFVAKLAGQNWQIILPISYQFKCWHLDKVLGYYHIRGDSHSQKTRSYDQIIELQYVFQDTIVSTLKTIEGVSPEHTQWAIQKYSYERLCYAKFYQKRTDVWNFSMELLSVTPDIGQKIKILAEAIYHILVRPIFSK